MPQENVSNSVEKSINFLYDMLMKLSTTQSLLIIFSAAIVLYTALITYICIYHAPLSNNSLLILFVIGLFNTYAAFRMGNYAKRYGFNYYIFFFISIFFTQIPITLFILCVYFKQNFIDKVNTSSQLPSLQARLRHKKRSRLPQDEDNGS